MNNTFKLILYLLFLYATSAQSQQSITLDEAIQLALTNNPGLQAARHRLSYAKAMESTAWDIPATDVRLDAGQFNSIFFDTRIGISQSFSLPMVYRRKKHILLSETAGASEQIRLNEAEIRRNLSLAFSTFAYYIEKEKMLQSFDSLYTQYEQLATSRMLRGETDAIEKAMASRQTSIIKMELQTVINEKSKLLLFINNLIFAENEYIPRAETLQLPSTIPGDTTNWKQHPWLQLNQNRVYAAEAYVEYKKSLKMPSFALGYNNLSIRGVGADNLNYNASSRFNYIEAGIQIPLFRKSLQADIEASSYQILTARAENLKAEGELLQEIQAEKDRYRYLMATFDEYNRNTLPPLTTIEKTALSQLKAGSINYLEYAMLIHQLFQAKEQYLDILRQIQEARIQLQYLTHKY